MVEAVCFDLMDTLIVDPYLDAVRAGTGRPLGAVAEHRDTDAWAEFELGAIAERVFEERFFRAGSAGVVLDRDAFHRARRSGYAFVPGMPQLMADLRGLVHRYIASNYPIWIEELRERFGLDEHVEGVFASYHLGVRKPDPAFFTSLLRAIGREGSRCLFVDDRETNCEAARRAGMKAHRFVGADDLRARLRREGVAVP